MDELGSLWTYQLSMEDLIQKLHYSNTELETARREAKEQARKNEEDIKNLIHLLSTANKERDEARDQLQKILNKLTLIPAANKANSSITESNSLGSSPVESLFDAAAVSSPEFSNFPCSAAVACPADLVIETLAAKRKLPERGRLMQAVMDAGPLLTTLLVAGPLPQWRNPPPQIQSFRIPMVTSGGAANVAPGSSSYLYGDSQRTCSGSVFNFGNGGPAMVPMRSGMNERFPIGKRQRLH